MCWSRSAALRWSERRRGGHSGHRNRGIRLDCPASSNPLATRLTSCGLTCTSPKGRTLCCSCREMSNFHPVPPTHDVEPGRTGPNAAAPAVAILERKFRVEDKAEIAERSVRTQRLAALDPNRAQQRIHLDGDDCRIDNLEQRGVREGPRSRRAVAALHAFVIEDRQARDAAGDWTEEVRALRTVEQRVRVVQLAVQLAELDLEQLGELPRRRDRNLSDSSASVVIIVGRQSFAGSSPSPCPNVAQ